MKFQSALLGAAFVAANLNLNEAFSPSSISLKSRQHTTSSLGMVATTEIVDSVVMKPKKSREVSDS